MKIINSVLILVASLLLVAPPAYAELVDSVKFGIGEVSVTNPHPDLESIYVVCAMHNYMQGGKSAKQDLTPYVRELIGEKIG